MPPRGSAQPVLERIRERILINDIGCWLWLGQTVTGGYGRITVGSRSDGTRRKVLVHRAAYEAVYGPVPEGLTLDHFVCDNPSCCNPDHVRPATMWENTRRSPSSPTAVNARKAECPQCGSPYSYRKSGRGRFCRPCRNAYYREYNSKR